MPQMDSSKPSSIESHSGKLAARAAESRPLRARGLHSLGGVLLGGSMAAGVVVACGGETDPSTRRQLANDLRAADNTAPAGEVDPGAPQAGASEAPPPLVAPPPETTAGPGMPQSCGLTQPPMDGTFIKFTEYDLPSTGSWGDTAVGHITGGTSLYSCAPTPPCTAAAAPVTSLTAGVLNVTATIPPGGYNGIVLWTAPCINPANFAGLTLVLGGELAGARLVVKPQAYPNYPIDVANTKGGCVFMTEATKFSDCVPPEAIITTLTPEPAPQSFVWSQFTGGTPLQDPPLDPAKGLVGLELQFQCQGKVDCAIDVSFESVSFTLPPE